MAIGWYGYQDGSGEYYIIIDGDKCQGAGCCGAGCNNGGCCLSVCPSDVFSLEEDPVTEKKVVVIPEEKKVNLRYHCADCRSEGHEEPPCVIACKPGAITHTFFGRP